MLAGIELCISNNCKVVNMSSGTAPTNAKETRINAENSARETIKYLIFMLDSKDTKGDLLSHNRLEMEIKIKMVLMLNNMEDIFLQLMRRW